MVERSNGAKLRDERGDVLILLVALDTIDDDDDDEKVEVAEFR